MRSGCAFVVPAPILSAHHSGPFSQSRIKNAPQPVVPATCGLNNQRYAGLFPEEALHFEIQDATAWNDAFQGSVALVMTLAIALAVAIATGGTCVFPVATPERGSVAVGITLLSTRPASAARKASAVGYRLAGSFPIAHSATASIAGERSGR